VVDPRDDDPSLREQLVDHGRRLLTERLITGTAGNLSVRTPDGMLITPSGLPYDTMHGGDLCEVSSDGAVSGSSRRQPSSETAVHLAVYQEHSAVGAIVHFHGLHSNAVAAIAPELPVIHYYAVRLGGAIPVVPYSTFGEAPLARAVTDGLRGRHAVLMQNHGALCVGASLGEAFESALLLEWLCEFYLKASAAGDPRVLTDDEVADVAAKYQRRAQARADH
jgi:L-fuculose-phosphate aldolase